MKQTASEIRGDQDSFARQLESHTELKAQDGDAEHSIRAQEWAFEEWRYLSPMDVNGKSFTRVGRKGDGGYVMIDDLAALEVGQSALASRTRISRTLSWPNVAFRSCSTTRRFKISLHNIRTSNSIS